MTTKIYREGYKNNIRRPYYSIIAHTNAACYMTLAHASHAGHMTLAHHMLVT